MKFTFIIFILFLYSCVNESEKVNIKNFINHNNYILFDEPNINEINSLENYILIVERGSFGDCYLTSIRKSKEGIFCFYKAISGEELPIISPYVRGDTTNFFFQTHFIKIEKSDFDTIVNLTKTEKFIKMNDTFPENQFGGKKIEIIISAKTNIRLIRRLNSSEKKYEEEIEKLLFYINKLKPKIWQCREK